MSPRESIPDRLPRQFRGLEAIAQAPDEARAFGLASGLTEDQLARLCIIVEELVANLFDHGGLGDQDEVELGLASVPDGIRVTLVDRGVPFDPWTAPERIQRPQRGGGAGLSLVRAWARRISYGPTPQGNRLELLLPIER